MPQTLLTFDGETAPKVASSVPSGRRTSPGWPACQPGSAVTCGCGLPDGLIETAPRPLNALPANVWKTRCRNPSAERVAAAACAVVPLIVASRVNGTFGVPSAWRGVCEPPAVSACAAVVPATTGGKAAGAAHTLLGLGSP